MNKRRNKSKKSNYPAKKTDLENFRKFGWQVGTCNHTDCSWGGPHGGIIVTTPRPCNGGRGGSNCGRRRGGCSPS